MNTDLSLKHIVFMNKMSDKDLHPILSGYHTILLANQVTQVCNRSYGYILRIYKLNVRSISLRDPPVKYRHEQLVHHGRLTQDSEMLYEFRYVNKFSPKSINFRYKSV